jgi:low affinity Fe/Cu permease
MKKQPEGIWKAHSITPYPAHGAFAQVFTHFANWTAHASGRPATFILAVLLILVWCVTGPLFHFSDTWQLVINTGTTIVTFLMVFLIQNTQNRDSLAIQVKLDELVRALETADNKIVGIENLSETEVEQIREQVIDESLEPTRDDGATAKKMADHRGSHRTAANPGLR